MISHVNIEVHPIVFSLKDKPASALLISSSSLNSPKNKFVESNTILFAFAKVATSTISSIKSKAVAFVFSLKYVIFPIGPPIIFNFPDFSYFLKSIPISNKSLTRWSLSSSNVTKTQFSLFFNPSNINCDPKIVFPAPDFPDTRMVLPSGIPPLNILSRPFIPDFILFILQYINSLLL